MQLPYKMCEKMGDPKWLIDKVIKQLCGPKAELKSLDSHSCVYRFVFLKVKIYQDVSCLLKIDDLKND